jgi:hypothetical protein
MAIYTYCGSRDELLQALTDAIERWSEERAAHETPRAVE